MLSDPVREALAEIVDPCSAGVGVPIDIVEMGIVDDVEISSGEALVSLSLTSPSCMQFGYIAQRITESLTALPEVETVRFEHSQRLWSADRMATGARARLRAVRSFG